MTYKEIQALAALQSDEKLLTSALEHVKKSLWDTFWGSEAHESKKREEVYHLGMLLDKLKNTIQFAVNEANSGGNK